jgi:hypothetical protein
MKKWAILILFFTGVVNSYCSQLQDFSSCWLRPSKFDIDGNGRTDFKDFAYLTIEKADVYEAKVCGMEFRGVQVIAVNNQRTQNPSKLYQVLKKARDQRQVKVTALVNGKLKTIEVK